MWGIVIKITVMPSTTITNVIKKNSLSVLSSELCHRHVVPIVSVPRLHRFAKLYIASTLSSDLTDSTLCLFANVSWPLSRSPAPSSLLRSTHSHIPRCCRPHVATETTWITMPGRGTAAQWKQSSGGLNQARTKYTLHSILNRFWTSAIIT